MVRGGREAGSPQFGVLSQSPRAHLYRRGVRHYPQPRVGIMDEAGLPELWYYLVRSRVPGSLLVRRGET